MGNGDVTAIGVALVAAWWLGGEGDDLQQIWGSFG